ncbi:MAG: TolC family protein [Hungatella sp.]|nr:TolC family protein [Hungatella sp.]
MRPRKIMTALGLAGVLAAAAPVNVPAQMDKPESMDQETWARLRDDVLEYDEIADLVEQYNPTYQQVIKKIDINKAPMEEAAQALRAEASEMQSDAKEIKDQNPIIYQTYTAYAKAYKEAAKGFEKAMKSVDSGTKGVLGQTRKQLTSGVQQLMIGYSQALASKELVDTSVVLAQAAYDSTVTQRNMGMATDAAVESAWTSLQSAQVQQQALNDTLTSLSRQLCYMTGWPYDAVVEIRQAPAPNLAEIAAMNPETDLTKAIGNNYTLIEQRAVVARGTAGQDARTRTIEEGEAKLKAQLESLYQTVLEKQKAYEAATTALEGARITMDGNDMKYQLGMLGKLQYLQLRLAYLQQDMAATSAGLELLQAMESYRWAVEGIADIS